MFQMINDEKPTAEDRKMLWIKIGLTIVLFAALCGIVYFFAMTPYGK
jgi:flagellar basal body-associated protein FliL